MAHDDSANHDKGAINPVACDAILARDDYGPVGKAVYDVSKFVADHVPGQASLGAAVCSDGIKDVPYCDGIHASNLEWDPDFPGLDAARAACQEIRIPDSKREAGTSSLPPVEANGPDKNYGPVGNALYGAVKTLHEAGGNLFVKPLSGKASATLCDTGVINPIACDAIHDANVLRSGLPAEVDKKPEPSETSREKGK
jgi:CDGSH-type Zn-finger protein